MAGVVLLARESGRAGRAVAALGWAATLLLLSDPELIGDAGFQLSSLATAGLIAWATPIAAWFDSVGRGRLPRWLTESLGVSLAAQAATLPIVLVSFGRLAVLAPLVNLAVVPLVAPAMAAGLVALAGGVMVQAGVPEVVGAILAAPGWVSLRLLTGIVEVAAGLPFASLTLVPPLDTGAAGLTLAGLAALSWRHRRGPRQSRIGGSSAAFPAGASHAGSTGARGRQPDGRDGAARRRATLALVIAVAIAGGVAASRPSGSARVTILDVGQGDAVLVEGSRGGRLLVDGGPDPDRLLVALDRRIPPWDRRIDTLILSHPHEDHVAGLPLLLERYRVDRVMEPGMRGPGPGYAAWLRQLSGPGAPIRTGLAAGDRLTVDEITLRVLWPIRGRVPVEPPDGGTGINNVSIVLAGQVGTRRFLLMGDVEQEIDPELLAAGLPHVDLLKVAHHGSRTATTQAFVDAVRPRIAVASAGAGNPYGHPARVTLERLASAGAQVLRTDLDGTVVVGFEPNGLTVGTERRRPISAPKPSASTSVVRFRCAIPVTAILPEREPARARAAGTHADAGYPDAGWQPIPGPGPSRAVTVGYHRVDDRSRTRGARLPPALPSSPTPVRPAHARGRRGLGQAGYPDRQLPQVCQPAVGTVVSAAARVRRWTAFRLSGGRAPPRRELRGLSEPDP